MTTHVSLKKTITVTDHRQVSGLAKGDLPPTQATDPRLPPASPLPEWIRAQLDQYTLDAIATIVGDSFLGNQEWDTRADYHALIISFIQSPDCPLSPADKEKLLNGIQSVATCNKTFETPEEHDENVLSIQKRIRELKPGESLVMGGGWKPTDRVPGHYMLYRFTRQDDNHFNLEVWNTGSGQNLYHNSQCRGGKKRYSPVLQFVGLTAEELDLSNPSLGNFIERLHHVTHPRTNTNASCRFVYSCFGAFKSKQKEIDFFTSPQSSGTCCFKPWSALIRYIVGDDAAYHLFKLGLRWSVLRGHFAQNKWQENSEQGAASRKILKEGMLKCIRAAAKQAHPLILRSQENEMRVYLFEIEQLERKLEREFPPAIRSIQDLCKTTPPVNPNLKYQVPEWGSSQHLNGTSCLETIRAPLASVCTTLGLSFDHSRSSLCHVRGALSQGFLTELGLLIPLQMESGRLSLADEERLLTNLAHVFEEFLNQFRHPQYPGIDAANDPYFFAAASSYLALIQNLANNIQEKKTGRPQRFSFFPIDLLTGYTQSRVVVSDPHLLARLKDLEMAVLDPQIFDYSPTMMQLDTAYTFFTSLGLITDSLKDELRYEFKKKIQIEGAVTLEQELAAKLLDGHSSIQTNFPHLATLLNAVKSLGFDKSSQAFTKLYPHGAQNAHERNYSKLFFTFFEHSNDQIGGALSDLFRSNRAQHELDGSQESGVVVYTIGGHPWHSYGQEPAAERRAWASDPVRQIRTTDREPNMVPLTVLQFFAFRIGLLKQPHWQQAFMTIFFEKDPSTGRLLIESKDDMLVLLKHCRAFIKEGLNEYWSLQPGMKPDIPTCLFFIRLLIWLKKIDGNFDIPEIAIQLEKWLIDPQIDIRERGDIHLHRMMLEAHLGPQALLKRDGPLIMRDWFVYEWVRKSTKLLNLQPLSTDVGFYAYARLFLASIAEGLQRSALPTDIESSLRAIGLTRSGDWKRIEPSLWSTSRSEPWTDVDLLCGLVQSSDGAIALTRVDRKLQLIEGFFIPVSESPRIRMLIPKDNTAPKLYLYHNRDWYQQISLSDWDVRLPIPWPLLQGSVWHCHAPNYIALDKDNTIMATSNGTTSLRMGAEFVSLDQLFSPLEGVERQSRMLLITDDQGMMREVRCAYLQSTSDIPLVISNTPEGPIFVRDGTTYRLHYDPTPSSSKKGPLGLLDAGSFLALQDVRTGQPVVVLPVAPIKYQRNLKAIHCLNNDEQRSGTFGNPVIKRYVIAKLVNGEWVSPEFEGKLMLAYVYMCQHDYDRAYRIIINCPQTGKLSKTSEMIFAMFFELPDLNGDLSPQAIALLLRLFALQLKHAPSSGGPASIITFCEIYQSKRNNIPPHLLLSQNEEFLLRSYLNAATKQDDDSPIKIKGVRKSIHNQAGASKSVSKWSFTFLLEKDPPAREQYRNFSQTDRFKHFLYQLVRDPAKNESIQRALEQEALGAEGGADAYLIMLALKTTLADSTNTPRFEPTNAWLDSYCTFLDEHIRRQGLSSVFSLTTYDSPIAENPSARETTPVQPVPLGDLSSLELIIRNGREERPPLFRRAGEERPPYENKSGETLSRQFVRAVTPEHIPDTRRLPPYGGQDENSRASIDALIADVNCHLSQQTPGSGFQLQNRDQLSGALSIEIDQLKLLVQSQEAALLALANTNQTDDDRRLEAAAYMPRMNIQLLITAFLRGGSYHNLNPRLSSEEIQRLDQAIAQYLTDKTELQHLQRIDQASSDDQIAEMLAAERQYKTNQGPQSRFFLVFEERLNLRMRPDQSKKLRHLIDGRRAGEINQNLVQMMMGGGKTSIMAALLMVWATQENESSEGGLAMFIVPDGQFDSVYDNFTINQERAFRQGVIPLRIHREEMTENNLQKILEQLHHALQTGQVVVTTTATLIGFYLELLSIVDQKDRTYATRGKALREIIKLLKKRANGVLDEIDIHYRADREVNFPSGDPNPVIKSQVRLIQNLFQMLVSPDIMVGDKSIRDFVKLHLNEQGFMTEEDIKGKLLPCLVEQLSMTYPSYQIIPEMWKEALKAYLLGVTEENASAEVKQLVDYLKKNKQLADQVALGRYLISEILPTTLKRITNRHYGRSNDGLKVVPYLAANTPSETEFGNVIEALVLQFQTAISTPFNPETIQVYIDNRNAQARTEAQRLDVLFNETPTAVAFERIFGIPLADVDKNKEKVIEKARQDINIIITIEEMIVNRVVTYYDELLSGNAQLLPYILHRHCGFSGTPWNKDGYPKFLTESALLDGSVEARITDLFLRREAPIHAVRDTKVATLLATATRKICGIIDTAGMLRDYPTFQVAQEVITYYARDPDIEGVLYFEKDTLMYLKKEVLRPIVVGSTLRSELERLGINPDTTFTFYDERHCEATDLKQRKDAVNLITFDQTVSLRTLLQGLIRLREYMTTQNVEIVVPAESVKHFEPTSGDIIRAAIERQGTLVSTQTYRAFRQKIRSASMESVVKQLLETETLENAIRIVHANRELCVTTLHKSPWEDYGGLPRTQDCRVTLLARAPERLQPEIRDCLVLPKTIRGSSDTVGEEVTTERQAHRQTNVDTSLEQELEQSVTPSSAPIKAVNEWMWDKELMGRFPNDPRILPFTSLFSDFRYQKPYVNIFGIPNLFATNNLRETVGFKHSVFNPLQKEVKYLLASNRGGKLSVIALTMKEAGTIKKLLSMTKPQDQWLMMADGRDISTHSHAPLCEAHQAELKKILLLVAIFRGDIKLIDGEFAKEAGEISQTTASSELIKRFLRLRLMTLGNPLLTAIFESTEVFDADREDLLDEQVLATKRPDEYTEKDTALIQYLRKREQIQGVTLPKLIQLFNSAQVKLIADTQVPHLSQPQVERLGDPRLINLLNANQLGWLLRHQISHVGPTLTEHLIPAQVQYFSHVQLQRITVEQLPGLQKDQLPHIPDGMLRHLNGDLVKWIPIEKLEMTTPAQVPGMSDQQIQALQRPGFIQAVPNNKVHLLTETQIPHLQASQIPHVDKIHCVSNAMIQFLTNGQVARIPLEKLTQTIPIQIHWMSDEQLKQLDSAAMIQAVPNNKVHLLTETQIPHLQASQIPHVDKIHCVSNAMIQFLTNGQVARIPLEKLTQTIPTQVKWMSDEQIKRLDTPVMIQAVPLERVPLLTQNQIPHLQESQIAFLVPPQIEFVLDTMIQHLTESNQIIAIPQAKLGFATTDQVRWMSREQIQELQDPNLIKAVPNTKVGFLIDAQIKHIRASQASSVLLGQVTLIPEDLLLNATPDQIRGFLTGQSAWSLFLKGCLSYAVSWVPFLSPPTRVRLQKTKLWGRLAFQALFA
jgi:hypothetical protein